jgi:HPt (histidine-containing phosphotransfer) domain-containing protein
MVDPIDRAALDELVEMTGGDRAFLADLIDTFSTEAAGMLAELEAAAANGDAAGLLAPAHSMKSNAASFGAHGLAELCRAIEHDAREGSVPDAEARVASIRESLAAVEAALQSQRDGPT